MPSTLFDSAGLAIVAYVQVDGLTGSSNSTALANSGIYTTKVQGHPGDYLITLSTAIGQDPSRDLIFVQPTLTTAIAYTGSALNSPIPSAVVTDHDDFTKEVQIGSATTALDNDFNVLVLRTILP